ncbi:hypothetical protein IWQ57_003538 [Coemansia nantahalensis]|uniref:Uncharacterized protein n=1 Tax=Coemansia nantahalensis TaxID=2789366 RepID=A0ACC1JW80_9FUNG|nr:hypothetical protein IWQ57_003538 [Coemansia nantahalensis]
MSSSRASFHHGYGGASTSEQQYSLPPPGAHQQPHGYEHYSHPTIMRSPAHSQCGTPGVGLAGHPAAAGHQMPGTAHSLYSAAAEAMGHHSRAGQGHHYEKTPAHSVYSQGTGYTGLSRETLSEYASHPHEQSASYGEVHPRERGIKNYFMKTKVDEFGTPHEAVSKSKFAVALAISGAAAFAAKKGFDRYRANRMPPPMMGDMHPGSPCMSGSMAGSHYDYQPYGAR